jgi:filamentous hemagglutinin
MGEMDVTRREGSSTWDPYTTPDNVTRGNAVSRVNASDLLDPLGGHVFNAVNQDGVVRFLDGQTGKPARFDGYSGWAMLRTNWGLT